MRTDDAPSTGKLLAWLPTGLALAIDSSTPPYLYWVAGLVRCSSAAGICSGKPLVPAPKAGIALDATNIYYLRAGVLSRVAK